MGYKTRTHGSGAQIGQKYQEDQRSYPYGARAHASGRSQTPQTRSLDSMKAPKEIILREKPKTVTVSAPRGVKVKVKRKKSNPIVFSIGREKGLSLSYEKPKKASEVEHPRDAAKDPLFRRKAKWSSRSRQSPPPPPF